MFCHIVTIWASKIREKSQAEITHTQIFLTGAQVHILIAMNQPLNECACLSRVRHSCTRGSDCHSIFIETKRFKMAAILKFSGICLNLRGVRPKQNNQGCYFQESFHRDSSTIYLFQQKNCKYLCNNSEFFCLKSSARRKR